MERLLSLLLLLGTALQVSCSLVSLQPLAPEIFEGQSLNLSCNTLLMSPLTFSWLRDSTLLLGETDSTLSVSSVPLEWNDSVLTCVIENVGNTSTRLSVFPREPVFTEHPSSVTVDQGSVFSLSCSVRGFPPPTVQWYKDGSVFLVIAPQGTSLVFPPASDEYEGVYRCRALQESSQPVFSNTAIVTVRFPPEFNIQPESLSVLNNTAASLNCSAKGNPPPTISWFHNGEQVTPGDRLVVLNNGSLIIEAVRMTDSGVYRCHANNSLGNIESDDALLMVDLFPLFRRTPQDTTAQLGDSAVLNCSVFAIPTADYTWRRDGLTLTLDGVRLATDNGSLILSELYRNDSGSYECTASNLYGEVTSQPALLTVLGPPLPPTVTLREIGSSWLFLSWDPPPHTLPPVGNYHLLYRLAIHSSYSEMATQQQFLNLTGLYPNAHYLVKARAESPLGLSDSSPLVSNTHTLTGLPNGEGVKDGPDHLLVEHTSPQHITVHWTVPQELLNTSYEGAQVSLLTRAGANVMDAQSVQSPVSLTDLSPATDYSVEIAFLFTGGHTGPRTRRSVTTLDGIPSQPEDLSVTLLSPTTLILDWEIPSEPNGTIMAYTVTVGTREIVVRDGNTTELLLGNLTAYTVYILRVSANTSAGQGEAASINITTHQDVPPPPSGLSVQPINSTALLLSWQPPSPLPGVLLHYTIMYNDQSIVIAPPTRTLELTDLSPYTLYQVSIAATTEAGIGNFSSTQDARTLVAAPTAIAMVSSVVQSCPHGITVSWLIFEPSAINGPPSETSLRIDVFGGEDNRTIAIGYQEAGSFTIENVTSFTNYAVAMAIFNANGSGRINNSVTIMSCDSIVDPPDNVAVDTITSTSLRVTWQPVVVSRGMLVGYIVTYRKNESEHTAPTNSTSIILTNLTSYTTYVVSVSTVTGGGPGNSSPFLTVTTLSDVPTSDVMLLSAMAECPSDLLLTWMTSDPSGVNGLPNMTTLNITLVLDSGSEERLFPYNTSGYGEIRLTELLLSTNYTLLVALTNVHGTGPQSTPLTASTLSQGLATPPQTLTALSNSLISLLVSWQPPHFPNGDPNYIVTYRRANSDDNYTSISTRALSTNISDLMLFTRYHIEVSANTSCGVSNSTQVIGQTPPTVPNDLRVVVTLPSAIVVEWSAPTSPNPHPDDDSLVYMVACGDAAAVTMTMMLSHECSGLESNTSYIVTVTASIGEGQGPFVSIETRTACQDPVPMVTAKDDGISVYLPTPANDECDVTRADYVLVVVQELTSDPRPSRPLNSYTLEELVEATQRYSDTRPRRQVIPTSLYISANISESQLQGDPGFTVGDGSDYGGYMNYPLKPGVYYTVGLRGVVSGATTPIFADSSVSPPFTALPPEATPPVTTPPTTEPPTIPVVIVAAVAGASAVVLFAILLVACIICACSYWNKRASQYIVANGNGSGGERITRSSSFRLSAKKKAGDPVDDFRANHRTEALEDHPPVPVVGFIQKLFVMRTNDNQLFLEEFGSINMVPQHSTEVADSNANKRKNRYNNILPYDNNRVKIKSHGSDYINASYCSGYMKNKIYIATQGPIAETVGDFWRLVWEENVRVIIMLTNTSEKGKVKCETYWPRDLGCSAIHGHIEVIMDQATALADFTIRTFSLQKGSKESRQVKQFHFTSWPDHGVPQHATAMLSMLRRVRSYHSKVAGGPMLVHCSAGVGRTGTFIVIDSMLERLKNSDALLDIYGHVTLLRTQRPYMVQTEDQYFFIHEALAEALLCGNTEVNLTTLGGYVTELGTVVPGDQHDTTHIEIQFKRLAIDKNDPYRYVTATKESNKPKNRLVNILPYETNRVVLEYLHGVDGSDYINASHIDSYHHRRAFIATQGPLQSTIGDFWRMVWQYNSPVVVMLTETMEKGMERCAQYWPSEVLQSAVYDRFTVELAVERRSQHYTFRDINITDNQTGTKRCVSHFQFHGWPEVGIPATPSLLLDFIREVQKMYSSLSTHAPITVHCSSGVGRSGVFITLHITLERMKTEGLVDVFQTVKTLRIQRPAMVQTLQQYHFCYESALHYLESSDLLLTQQRSAQPSAEVSRKRSFRHTPPSSQPSPSRTAHTTPSRKESFKGSTRTFEAAGGAHIYGVSEATSTFGSHQASGSGSQIALYGSGTLGQQTLSGSQLSVGQRSRSPRLGGSQSALNTPPPVGGHVRNASMSGVPHQLAESQRYSTSSVTGWTQ